MTHRRRKTITVSAVIIYGYTAALLLNPVQILADRDAHLQEKYFLDQLKKKKKGGFLFGRRKKRNSDPAVQYQRQQRRLSDSAYLSIAIFLLCLAASWIFRVSFFEMGIMWIGCLCSNISDFTGSFAQPRSNETSRRKKDRNKVSSRSKKQSSSRRNSFNDNQSISTSVLEIIDMETIGDDSLSSSPGVMSTVFGSMTRAGKKFVSSSKQKNTPHNQRMDRSSSSRIQKCHRDKSSLRLRASSKQTSGGRDEELGDDDKSDMSLLPGLPNFGEDDECSDNGTAFAIKSPMMPSPKRAGSTPSKSKKQTSSSLQKKLSCELEDAKQHRSHHHRSSHRHNSRRHKRHQTPAA